MSPASASELFMQERDGMAVVHRAWASSSAPGTAGRGRWIEADLPRGKDDTTNSIPDQGANAIPEPIQKWT